MSAVVVVLVRKSLSEASTEPNQNYANSSDGIYVLGESSCHLFARHDSSRAAVLLVDCRLAGMHGILWQSSIHQLHQPKTAQSPYHSHPTGHLHAH